jgi:predicted RNA-binding protein
MANIPSHRPACLDSFTVPEATTPKKHNITKQAEQIGFNTSFLTPENMRWFATKVLGFLPDAAKPLVFLPCGSAAKTREKFGKKMISQGLGHQLMSAVTREPSFERVILSEPLTIIPYALEGQHPDYNLPPQDLSIQSERIFINQLALWLARVKAAQPDRRFAYYIGAMHHYFILHLANEAAGRPFHVVREIPARGVRDFAEAAKRFKETIMTTEAMQSAPEQAPASLDALVKGRGRYTHRKFWRSVLCEQLAGDEATRTIEPVTTREQAKAGFADLYPTTMEGEDA